MEYRTIRDILTNAENIFSSLDQVYLFPVLTFRTFDSNIFLHALIYDRRNSFFRDFRVK